jgi:hypothetical protein
MMLESCSWFSQLVVLTLTAADLPSDVSFLLCRVAHDVMAQLAKYCNVLL